MNRLFAQSVEIILRNQDDSGAYVASPSFPPYRYCWFRDSSFIAYAMDLAKEHSSAARFHYWAADVVNTRRDVIQHAIGSVQRNEPVGKNFLHARYRLNGQESNEEWANFQLDGLGTWLWSMAEHCRLGRVSPPERWERAAELVADYLTALWLHSCYDCWEEFPDYVHTYTIAAIYGGLRAHGSLSGKVPTLLPEMKDFLLNRAVKDGHFVKFIGAQAIDANLIALSTPYRVVEPDDPLMRKAIEEIESTLYRGGVHRYGADTYYGGGAWVLLTAWLGWYYAETGQEEKAKEAAMWVEQQADEHGYLPEQVPVALNAPDAYPVWQGRWGDIARPLLWSHANYIILSGHLGEHPAG